MPLRSVKKKLNAHVKTLARMVDSDWHDGYEEQGEECMEWIASCGALVESALRVGVAFGCGHELGHAVLMCAAALPMAGAPAMKGAGGTRTALSALPLRGATRQGATGLAVTQLLPTAAQARRGHLGPDREDPLPVRPRRVHLRWLVARGLQDLARARRGRRGHRVRLLLGRRPLRARVAAAARGGRRLARGRR